MVARVAAPELGAISDLDFPKVQRTKLSNGVEIVYAQRSTVPLTQVSLSFDAGNAADPRDKKADRTDRGETAAGNARARQPTVQISPSPAPIANRVNDATS